MLKGIKKSFILMFAVFAMITTFTVVAQARNQDNNLTSGCQRWTASGTNRSGTCNVTHGNGNNPRRGRSSWSHQQFNLSTTATSVTRGSFNSANMLIVANNGVTGNNQMIVRHGNTGSVSRTRVAFVRPYSGMGLLN